MTAFRLLWRQFVADPLGAIALAIATALLAGVAAALPLVSADLAQRQLRESLADLSAQQGDVAATWTLAVPKEGVAGMADPWEVFRSGTSEISAQFLPPLREVLGPPSFLATSAVVQFTPETQDYYRVTLHPFVDPRLIEHAVVVRGAWPQAQAAQGPAEVAVLDDVAVKLGLEVGKPITSDLVLSGTYKVTNPDDPRWQQIPLGSRFNEPLNPDRGVEMVAGAALAPRSFGPRSADLSQPVTFKLWFPVDRAGTAKAGIDVGELRSQLTGLLARRFPIVSGEGLPTFGQQDIKFDSDLGETLGAVIAQQRIAGALIAVTAAGPVGVALALVLLAARLVVHRRRQALSLILARGASREQLGRVVAIEGLLVGLPAATIGLLVAEVAFPGTTGPASWAAAGGVGLLPAIALTWSARSVRSTAGRVDLRSGASRWRVVGETLLLVVTGAALWQVQSRTDDFTGLDLLGSATPILLAGTVTMLALRFYPYPLRALARLLRRSALAAQLGVLRAVRDPAGGLLPVATVVLGTTMAVLGATLLGTITAGTRDAVWQANGASIRLSGPIISDDMLAQIRSVDGVAAASRIHSAGSRRQLTASGTETSVELWLADPALLEAYAGSPLKIQIPPAVFSDAEPAGVLVGGAVPVASGAAQIHGLGAISIVGKTSRLPGVSTASAWVLADVEAWSRASGSPPAAKLVLVALKPGADPTAVSDQIRDGVGVGLVTTVQAQLASVTDSPIVAGLSRVFMALAMVTGVLLIGTLVVAQLMGSAARARTVTVLRTLGMPTSRARSLTVWELAPALVLAFVVGTVTGIALAYFVVATIDFAAVTGGSGSLSVTLTLASMGWVYGILAGGLLVAILASNILTARSDLAAELRRGDAR